ncbi:MAG: biotin transporter BioY [Bifidobacteriaceae bacterium]|jgi:biotin transport system substrate-specific component|nr:biotin transporter BioY [Bifidobacteriaceae bacterium]
MTATAAVPQANPARRAGVLADIVPGTRVRDAALILAGAGLVAGLGQVSIPLGFTPVPLSLGTFAVLSVGAALGPWRAAASLALFTVAGVLGAPVFVEAKSGWGGPSFGYVLGYLAAAVLVGWLARRGGDRSVPRTWVTMAAGTLVIYAVGVPWLGLELGVSAGRALALGVVPFLIGDAIKALAAALLLPGAWRLAGGGR